MIEFNDDIRIMSTTDLALIVAATGDFTVHVVCSVVRAYTIDDQR